jgi:NAD(P)-dependent dehydrogenase (short-subunit alcohol dehydrogenase family)
MPERVRVALVTGANRGIGLAVASALAKLGQRVYLSAPAGHAESAASKLREAGLEVAPLDLDVADPDSVAAALARIRSLEGRLDILVNNAGRGYDPDATASTVDLGQVRDTLEVNLFGPWRLAQAAVAMMREHGYGRIVNVSSDAGAFSAVASPPVYAGTPGYSVSKAAQNMLTVKLAAGLAGEDILVNCVDPGWVRTDMGGPDAPRTPEEAAEGIVWLATLPSGGPSGGFFHDRQRRPW